MKTRHQELAQILLSSQFAPDLGDRPFGKKGPDHGIGHFGFLRSIPHAHRGGLSGAGGSSTASKIAANMDRGF
jgi:hypothetical protein